MATDTRERGCVSQRHPVSVQAEKAPSKATGTSFLFGGTISCLSSTEMESVESLGAALACALAVVGGGLTCVPKAQSRLIVT